MRLVITADGRQVTIDQLRHDLQAIGADLRVPIRAAVVRPREGIKTIAQQPTTARALEARLAAADKRSVFEYAMKLCYPNGRSFDLIRESERPLEVGQEFDAFGHTWRIAGKVPPSRFQPILVSEPEAFACHPVSEPRPRSSR